MSFNPEALSIRFSNILDRPYFKNMKNDDISDRSYLDFSSTGRPDGHWTESLDKIMKGSGSQATPR